MRILLAEDEHELRKALTVILSQHNFSVDAVANGQEALDYIELGDNYDCLILDLMMPVMDGLEVIRNIRQKKIAIPILVLTAKGEIEDRVNGLDLGADDYLVKPFNSQELLARIRALTRRPIHDLTSILTYGNISLNRSNFLLETKDGQMVLPNKEFQILELLLTNPTMIVSSNSFLGRIWGLDADVDQNTVWVTLSNLRKRLISINSNVFIKSIRGVGYTLEINSD